MGDDFTLGEPVRLGFTNSGCLHCGKVTKVFSALGEEDARPRAGDITMCATCGGLQAINDACDGFRTLSPEEETRMAADHRVVKLREAQKGYAAVAATEGVKRVEILRGEAAEIARRASLLSGGKLFEQTNQPFPLKPNPDLLKGPLPHGPIQARGSDGDGKPTHATALSPGDAERARAAMGHPTLPERPPEHLLDLMQMHRKAPDVVPIVKASEVKNTSGLTGGWSIPVGGAAAERKAAHINMLGGIPGLSRPPTGDHSNHLFRLLPGDEAGVEPMDPAARIDLRDEGNRNFQLMTHRELEHVVGHKVDISLTGMPKLSPDDLLMVNASLRIKRIMKENPSQSGVITKHLRTLRKKDRRRIAGDGIKLADDLIESNQTYNAIVAEYREWIKLPPVLGHPDGSALHKFVEAGKAGQAFMLLRAPEDMEDPTIPRDLAATMGDMPSFVVEHDWSGVLGNADVSGDGSGEVALPYDASCFEFIVTGKRAFGVVIDRDGERRFITVVQFKAGWAVLMSYNITDGWKATPTHARDSQSIRELQPLADLLMANVHSILIMLEAKLVEREVVRIDAKLNEARARRGKLPIYDYHVVSISRRERAKPRSLDELDPNREITRKRFHLVRSHWRQYADHRTKVPWHTRGDINLGFVDKHYKL